MTARVRDRDTFEGTGVALFAGAGEKTKAQAGAGAGAGADEVYVRLFSTSIVFVIFLILFNSFSVFILLFYSSINSQIVLPILSYVRVVDK